MKKTVLEGEKQFTASVWILTRSTPKKMLLIHHKKLGKWQQPGGHIEQFENPIDTAVREVREETGIDISFLLEQVQIIDKDASFLPVPKFFMEQTIPEFSDQPKHYHLDIQYVVEVDQQEIKPSKDESQEVGWFTKEEISNLSTHVDAKVIVNKLM